MTPRMCDVELKLSENEVLDHLINDLSDDCVLKVEVLNESNLEELDRTPFQSD